MNDFKFEIGEEINGRIDRFLADQVVLKDVGITRSSLQRFIKEGAVTVNGSEVKANHKLKMGDKVLLKVPEMKESALSPEDISFEVLYEDNDVIVINKPAGLVVHPTDSDKHSSGTLVNGLLFHCKGLSGIGGVMRPGIVHRLDKGTSGVMVVAKNDMAHQNLSAQIQARKVKKQYVTLIKGRLIPERGSIDAPVGRSIADRKKMAVVEHKTSRHALTHYEVDLYLPTDEVRINNRDIRELGSFSLVDVDIVTGRTHQIRVHFQAIGFPVVGDATYGDDKINTVFKRYGLKRPFLHAKKLGFKLPSSGEWKEFEAPLSRDLEKVMLELGVAAD